MESTTSYTAEEIAALVEGDLFRSSEQSFTGIASLSDAEPSHVSFLGNEKYYPDFLKTKAGLVLAPAIVKEAPEGVALIHVENPTAAFSAVIEQFSQSSQSRRVGVSEDAIIDETVELNHEAVCVEAGAVLAKNVTLADGVVICSGAVIGANVTIGENTVIYQNVVVREGCEIGANVILQPGCVIGSDGFGYEQVEGRHKKIPQVGIVVIEDEVEIGANTTIDRARFGQTIISEGTKIDNLVQIAHNVILGQHNLMIAQSGVAGSTTTGKYVIIGAQGGAAGHLKIGDQVIIAGQSGLGKNVDIPGYYQGTPARPLKENRKSQALVNRLPKLLDRIKELEEKVAGIESQNSNQNG